MQFQGQKPAFAVLILAALIVTLTMIRARDAAFENEPDEPGGAGYASVADNQALVDDGAGSTVRRLARRPDFAGPVAELPPAEREKLIASQIVQLEQKLRSEPIDVAWARKQEAVIENAIVGSPTDGFDVPLPSTFDEQCHSSLCRIRMAYSSEEDALQMQSKLTLGLSGPISRARTFYLPTRDGGMELIVFAGNVDQP